MRVLRLCMVIFSLCILQGYVMAQEKIISGVVLSSVDKEPVIGATVIVKDNAKIGASTNIDGEFKLSVPKSTEYIQVSYIGMKTQIVKAANKVKVILYPDSKLLDEVVVVGMTNIDKRLFTGASSKISGDKSKIDGVPDAARSLEGRAAGVSVQNVSGTFGTAPKIRIRGATSIYGDSKPLWVVDGVVMDDVINIGPDDLASGDANTLISNAIAGLNPDDIESFQVLKDGSATSIYGARAMAGVIAVTTKKGKAGYSKISYTGEFTYRLKPSYKDYNIMNSQEQMSVYQELQQKGWLNLSSVSNAASSGIYGKMYEKINNGSLLNNEESKVNFLREAEYQNTDWFSRLFKNSILNTHSVSISSGTEKSSYYASMSAMFDSGWTLQSNVKRYTANLNTNYKITPSLSFNMIANASHREQKAPGTLSGNVDLVSGQVKRDFDINPFSYALNTSRVLSSEEFYTRNFAPFNIVHELNNNYMKLNIYDLKYQAELKWKALEGLEFSVLGDVKYNSSKNEHIITENSNQALAYRAMQNTNVLKSNPFLYHNPDTPLAFPKSILPEGGFYNVSEYSLKAWDFRGTMQYNHLFNLKHMVNIFAGMELNSIDRKYNTSDGYGIQYNEGNNVFFDYLAFKKMKEDGGNYFSLGNSQYRNVAMFANLAYSYNSIYAVNGTLRYEGTNKMGHSRKARWLPTWNISASWNISNEKFFLPLKHIVNNLSFKFSYSLTADKGPDWVNNSTVIINSANPWRNPASVQEPAYTISSPENKDLTYEKKHEFNFGFDASFFNDRINLTFDAYKRNNYDLIALMVTQGLTGSSLQYGNVASMESKGVELSLSTVNVKSKNFSWITNFVYAHATNKVTKFYSKSRLIDLVQGKGFALEGYPVRSIFSIPFAGLTAEGLPSFYTSDGSKTVSGIYFQERNNLDYLKYEGSADPTDFGSLGNTFKYKNFELNLFITYSMGNVIRLDPVFSNEYSDLSSMPKEFKNRWAKPGDEFLTNIPGIISAHQDYMMSNMKYAYNAYNYSDQRIAKGDFIRMKEVSLTYDLPQKWIKPLKLYNLSLKLQATNLFLIYSDRKLNGADPEFFNVGGVATPLPKQFTLTLRIGL